MEKRITLMPVLPKLEKELAVAAYARVSSGKDAMLHSLAQQISYYSEMIEHHPGWKYAGVYADEAVTGTKEQRKEFQRMLNDCRAGRINMILTKSISRFARNTVTLLRSVRELKELGVDVFFEESNIHSLSSDGELMLTILASFAQEESHSVSENQKWRIRKAYANGELLNWHMMFGYTISKSGGIQVNPQEAVIVKEIFDRIIQGQSLNSIAQWLNHSGIFGALGGKWNSPRLRLLIENEKLTGNALMQKCFVGDHLTKEKKINHGELPKYYISESHTPIIDQKTFDAAQNALKKITREHGSGKTPNHHDFTGMIRCPHCGQNFTWVTSNHTPGWVCPTYYREGKAYCESKKIPDETLKNTICHMQGWKQYDNDLFHRLVDYMVAEDKNEIAFYFHDGQVKNETWKDRSRSESWTPEMRAKVGEKTWRRYHG